uniref:C2 domain-containing protein 3 n=1 Tax=Zeugodacus cucurbitae TaxID=28588 RepID=A0A0A1WNU7_ZEUCU
MEAMRKLDATLVAYLAGETKLQSKQLESELELELDLNAPNDQMNDNDEYILEEFSDPIIETVENMTREELQLFRRIKSINLQLEALTLEPEGTKRMELLQNDTRPIFTVECQLSHELIQQLPRYEMFNIMQFESEKFHSLTQCTRFGQEAQRDINLAPIIDELDNALNGNAEGNAAAGDAPNFGRIHFAVWWREPGTCLNEMLGMGVFELRELYDAALLEQCKRITIQRRGVPLANIYLKINLLLCSLADTANNNAADISCEAALQAMKQHPGGGNKNKKGASGNASAAAAGGAGAPAAPNANNQSNTTAKGNNTKDNNDLKARLKSEFNSETLKIRLLTGLICACEVRYLEIPINREMHLVCERFWKTEPATAKSVGTEQFYYQEQFAILRDANFLNHVRGKHLRLLIYQRPLSTSFSDWNGNSDEPLEPLGLAFLPLHQFYIAFSNDEMTNRLMSDRLPVISIDAWAPIYGSNGQAMGEIKCLLAMGSEEQITTLKRERDIKPLHSDMFTNLTANSEIDYLYKSIRMPTDDCKKHAISAPSDQKKSIRTTVELMDMLQNALQQTNMASERAKNPEPSPSTTTSSLSTDATPSGLEDVPLMTFEPSTSQAAAAAGSAKSTPITTDAAAVDPTKPLEKPQFKFELSINCAVGLPLNPGVRCKPGTNEPKRSVSKRFPPGEPPSTYVTFQATSCDGSSGCYKSHEGNVYATRVVMRSVVPHWLQTFVVTVDEDYLKKPKQTFVLKLWKKANVPPANDSPRIINTSEMEPTPNDDAIIGFTALDLSVFLKGLHLAGVFNVFDFNGRITARLELDAKPADEWYVQYLVEKVWEKTHKEPPKPRPIIRMTPAAAAAARAAKAADAAAAGASTTDTTADTEMLEFGKSLDISHLNLNEAVNHKYNELKVISERLRTRLVDVTGESLSEIFNLDDLNNWQPLNEVINADVEMDEFERDINDPSAAADDAGTNKSDNKNENLISKTAPGAADPTIE